jgi:hypothetical protein
MQEGGQKDNGHECDQNADQEDQEDLKGMGDQENVIQNGGDDQQDDDPNGECSELERQESLDEAGERLAEEGDEANIEEMMKLAKERTELAMKRAEMERKEWEAGVMEENSKLEETKSSTKASVAEDSMSMIRRVTYNAASAVNPLSYMGSAESDEDEDEETDGREEEDGDDDDDDDDDADDDDDDYEETPEGEEANAMDEQVAMLRMIGQKHTPFMFHGDDWGAWEEEGGGLSALEQRNENSLREVDAGKPCTVQVRRTNSHPNVSCTPR